MSARQDLNSYLDQLQQRLRFGTFARGGSILAAVALATTVMLVLLIRLLLFSASSVMAARLTLLSVLGMTIGAAIATPLWRLTRRRAAATAESRFPQFQQRLMTFAERNTDDPFVELLAADTLEVARGAEVATLATNARLLGWLGLGVICVGVLIWLIAAAPGVFGYGSHLLWTASARGVLPRFDIEVEPGDVTIRRHSDQLVTARPNGNRARDVVLYAHYQSSPTWERVVMQPRTDAAGYQFTFTGVPESVEYYVEAGARRSRHFNIRIVDPPAIKQIRVTYHFPSWTGLADRVEEQGGDLRALEGTRADLEVVTDRPLNQGLLVLDNGQKIALSGGDNNDYRGVVQLQQDGTYHIAGLEQRQAVRLSEDYFIEARKPSAPTVSIARPGGDYRASPIEEVTVAVRATDEFGLAKLELHYSVNGGTEHTVGLLPRPGVKQAEGSRVLALEDFKLRPGDVIGLYATAKDARLESHTDMAFIQVDPFAREFSQSQAAGGGGGGGNESGEISQREKEIIAATFKQLNDTSTNDKQAAETAKFLSEVQTALRNQSLALAGRLRLRDLTAENSEFSQFQQEMSAAAEAMDPSSVQLQRQQWQDAIAGEQKALQHLLRAEATFRQIEVAYGARGGGGGGGSAGRDLASLFDLELDTEKNQYETQQTASSADQRAQDINDALKKLDELARRQEELAQQPPADSANEAEQRWQQEMLQREAQQLQQQMEQLAQSRRQGAAQGAAADARERSAQQATEQALGQLRQAQEDMRRASANGRGAAEARLAAQRLREAGSALSGLQSQQAARRLDAIASETQRLIAADTQQSERMRHAKEQAGNSRQSGRDTDQLINDRQRMADDLASLEQNMRNAERELDSSQPAAADKLRSALKEMDDSNLEPLVQRSADWLRTGVNPNARDTEAIASGLQRLAEQTQDARQALNAGGQHPEGAEEALNGVARLRRQIEGLGAASSNQASTTQPGGGVISSGYADNNIDTGDNARPGYRPAAPAQVASLRDGEELIQQGLGEIRGLSQLTTNDAEAQSQIRQLITDMQHLDVRRFPGNPTMVEHIRQQLLSDVDTLELQLRRNLDDQQPGQIHSADPLAVPRGYEDAVADYFRRLSSDPSGAARP